MTKNLLLPAFFLGGLLLSGCGPQTATNEINNPENLSSWEIQSMSGEETATNNLASQFCLEQGGKTQIKTDKDGYEHKTCLLANGEIKDEEKFYADATYLGLTVEEAVNKAKSNGVAFRIVEQDGEPQMVTLDLRPGRINAKVEKGMVTGVDIE